MKKAIAILALGLPLAAFLITAAPAVHAEKEDRFYFPPNTCRNVSCEFGVLMRSEKAHCDFIPLLRKAKNEWANSHLAAMEVVLAFPEGSNLGPLLAATKDMIDVQINRHKKNCIKDYPPHRKLNCDLAIQRISDQDNVVSYLKNAELRNQKADMEKIVKALKAAEKKLDALISAGLYQCNFKPPGGPG